MFKHLVCCPLLCLFSNKGLHRAQHTQYYGTRPFFNSQFYLFLLPKAAHSLTPLLWCSTNINPRSMQIRWLSVCYSTFSWSWSSNLPWWRCELSSPSLPKDESFLGVEITENKRGLGSKKIEKQYTTQISFEKVQKGSEKLGNLYREMLAKMQTTTQENYFRVA